MRIAVNTRLLLENKLEGIGRFTFESFKRIVIAHPEHKFYFIFDRPYAPSFIFAPNVIPVVIGPPSRHPLLWLIWFEFSIPRVLKRIKADIFISPDGYNTLRSSIPSCIVLHDLNFEYFPQQFSWTYITYLKYFFPKFARKATRIATVSAYSKVDICKLYKQLPEKVDVVYNGSSASFRPILADEKREVQLRYASGQPYFIYVGALSPRKNVARMLWAFDKFKSLTGSNMKFLIAGAKLLRTPDVENTYESMKYRNDVVFLGRVPEGDLEKVVAAAEAMVYVSYFEGFGIPVIEAMSADVPVIASNLTCMPEIAGDAALLTDPYSIASICNAMTAIISDKALRSSLIEKGRIRARFFSWDKTAENLWLSIQTCLNHN